MSDMRQKLLPVFLEESGRMLLQLDDFLAAAAREEKSLDSLEAAFRAAHTLKGTAALVQAEAVCTLSGRIEGMLEGHFEAGQYPSVVEYEAMALALTHLKQLIQAVEQDEPEPAGLLAEAELALKLAAALPGQRPLSELLVSGSGPDPFADDPELPEDLEPPARLVDPFADDPGFDQLPRVDQELLSDPFAEDPDLVSARPENREAAELIDDPFAEDPSLEADPADEIAPASASVPGESSVTLAESNSMEAAGAEPVEIEDPFADDPVLEVELSEETVPVPAPGVADVVAPRESELPAVEEAAEVDEVPVDPFAEDPVLHEDFASPISEPAVVEASLAVEPVATESYAERMRRRLESESAVGTAERLASTIISQRDSANIERNFSCCCFVCGGKNYYLPIERMVEIADLKPIVRLPLAPAVVRGLINLRGKVLPVIDLSLHGQVPGQYVAVRKLVVAEAAGEQLAFLTDGIPDLTEKAQGEKVDVVGFIEQFRAGAS